MADKKKDIIDPIDATFDEVVGAVTPPSRLPATPKALENKGKVGNEEQSPAPYQMPLDLGIQVEKTVEGMEMGVLQNGIPYLTQRGLATMSGAARATIFEITQEWEETEGQAIPARGRMAFFKEYLFRNGYDEPRLFIEISKNGSPHYAYPDIVCMAFLEYFAFEAQRTNDTAVRNYRNLARFGLEQFIYRALDYQPVDPWALHNSRVSLLHDSVPAGYFSVFKESTGFIVDLINSGLTVNQHTIPDASVGTTWGPYWTKHELAEKFGERIPYDHYFPPEFPQSASNPQSAWAYPEAALPTFRRWFREVYLPTKYPSYILKKAKVLPGGRAEAQRLSEIYQPKRIET